ncbi:putative pumilio/PUF RNA binding protein 9 [Leptomonas seymouri]|uniref:Putative pumilio/PUF RNA binding protein 9 n=1 Tax=Leptomonas seymouri TaxID=5684 RepID=A0A0N1I8V0_LEPSE|nr:putative pumilio/PUF RNA binding protein 9 [Leptomonas seymouri]|eukprot:KPI88172.1 putative pumilio/PUF RNA binding protein 9 [Leptomonas seymouri]
MNALSSVQKLQGNSVDENGISTLGVLGPRPCDGGSDAFALTNTGGSGGFTGTRLLSQSLCMQTDTPTAEPGPRRPTPSGVESQRAPICPTVDELCTLCADMELMLFQDKGGCPWTLIRVLAANAPFLAVTRRGCPAFMRVFQHVDATRRLALVGQLLPALLPLSLDAYANYAVQCIIEHTDVSVIAQYVLSQLAGHLLMMSCDKFASNVVEKVVRVCGGDVQVRQLLLTELIYDPVALRRLVDDIYGNFVLQSAVSTIAALSELGIVIRCLNAPLVNSPFATNILAKVNARRRELTASMLPVPQLPLPLLQPIACSLPLCSAPPSGLVSTPTPAAITQLASSSNPSLVFLDGPDLHRGASRLGGGRYRHSPYSMEHSGLGAVDTPLLLLCQLQPPSMAF